MHFVSFTLQPPGGVVAAIYGQFSAAKAQEIVVARPGGVLELLRPDEASGKAAAVHDPELGDDAASAATVAPTFVASDRPKNLLLLDEPASCRAITDVSTARASATPGDLRISEWKTPGRKAIEKAAANERQVAAALAGGEVIYFELDASGALAELGTKELGVEVACLDVGVVPAGRARAPFLALGGWDGSLRLLSLAPDELLVQVATMQLGARAESVRFCETPDGRLGVAAGLANGVLQRAAVDASTGQLGDARALPRVARRAPLPPTRRALASSLSPRAWLCYAHAGRLETAPLSYDALEHAAGFKSEQCPEGVVAIASTLRIFVPDKLGETFNQASLARAAGGGGGGGGGDDMDLGDGAGGGGDGAPRVAVCGPTPPADGKWASSRPRRRPVAGRTLELLELGESEAALSCATVSFAGRGGEVFVAVGTARSLTFHPRAHEGCYVHVYRLLESRLVLLHRTEVDDVPLGLAEFRGRPRRRGRDAAHVEVVGDRIFVADAAMSVHLARYVRDRNRLAVFADDPVGRATARSRRRLRHRRRRDKFGNVAVLRLGPECSDDVDDAAGDAWDNGRNGGAPNKLTQLATTTPGACHGARRRRSSPAAPRASSTRR
ncbi:hypothetical protein JL722_4081 [Aureococcus anophagefferens]|nr:hypothetical protein JL722_4081 [Aureococcus anophagefferens]